MELITACKEKVLKGAMLTRDEALLLAEEDINKPVCRRSG